MTTNIVPMHRPPDPETIEIAESLLAAVKAGEIVSFAAVGIEPNDATRSYTGNAYGAKTNLAFMGAMWRLLHAFSHDT